MKIPRVRAGPMGAATSATTCRSGGSDRSRPTGVSPLAEGDDDEVVRLARIREPRRGKPCICRIPKADAAGQLSFERVDAVVGSPSNAIRAS